LLVFQQPPHQFLPGVVQRIVDFATAWQHHTRLDFDERACHLQKIAHAVDVELLQDGQVLQKLLCDRGDRNVDDFHLRLTHQVQEQVQRTAENVQIDAKIHVR